MFRSVQCQKCQSIQRVSKQTLRNHVDCVHCQEPVETAAQAIRPSAEWLVESQESQHSDWPLAIDWKRPHSEMPLWKIALVLLGCGAVPAIGLYGLYLKMDQRNRPSTPSTPAAQVPPTVADDLAPGWELLLPPPEAISVPSFKPKKK